METRHPWRWSSAHPAVQVTGARSASGQFVGVDIRAHVKGGGHVAEIYATRQPISKALMAYYQKYVDEASKKVRDIVIQYDWTMFVFPPSIAVSLKSSEVLAPMLDSRNPTHKPTSGIRVNFVTNILGF